MSSWSKALLGVAVLGLVVAAWLSRYDLAPMERGAVARIDRWTGEICLVTFHAAHCTHPSEQ